jgi:hypothetical protein
VLSWLWSVTDASSSVSSGRSFSKNVDIRL